MLYQTGPFVIPHDWQTSSEVSAYTAISSLQSKQMLYIARSSFALFISINSNEKTPGKSILQPQRLLEGFGAIKKLAQAAKVTEDVAKQWLFKQAFWQIYLPTLRYIPRPKFDVPKPNAVHQAGLLFLPHDKPPRSRKVYKYALTVDDVASRYKEAEPLTSKDSAEVAKAFQSIYKRGPLTWPWVLQVDPLREFMGNVTKEMENHKTCIRRGRAEIHRDQAIVERFNRTLAERLFGH